MKKQTKAVVAVVALSLLAACGKKEEPTSAPTPAASSAAVTTPTRSTPDFGGVTKVSREVEAVGSTLELAVVSALQSAVAQVNGVKVASQLQSLRTGLDVAVDGNSAVSVRTEAFAQAMVAKSQGLVLGYEILKQEEIEKLDEETLQKVRSSDGGYSYSASASSSGNSSVSASTDARASANARANSNGSSASANADANASESFSASSKFNEKANVDVKRGATSYSSDVTSKKMQRYWKVRVRADIAQFRAPDETGRPKIVVSLPKTLSKSYAVGDGNVPADEVARAIRGRLSDILTQTKRFIVLDREFGADLQAEIDHIQSGNVRAQDAARIGQQMATDLILIPTIERFGYPKEVRKLRMSDRELVSYSGGGRITLRLLNASTGEVVLSDSFEHKLASSDPSTMPRVIDGNAMAAEMMEKLSGQIGTSIVSEIFPVSVVALSGDQAVLSQGGDSLQVGQRWQAVLLGDKLKDPQTGRSLGRSEIPLGSIRIDRVSTQTSYGTLEEGAAKLGDKPFAPGTIELRKQIASDPVKSTVASSNDPQPSNKQPTTKSVPQPKSPVKQGQEGEAAARKAPDISAVDKW